MARPGRGKIRYRKTRIWAWKKAAILTDTAPERNFTDTGAKRRLLPWPWPRFLCLGRSRRTRSCSRLHVWTLTLLLAVPVGLVAEPLVLLVQPPVWAQQSLHFDAQPFAQRLSVTLGRQVRVRYSEDVLSHWRAVRSGRGFDLVIDEAHFTAYRISHHGFTALAQARSEVRYAVVVRPRTLITAPSDLSAHRVAAPAPPSLAALRLLNLFADKVHAPVLVTIVRQEDALLALSAGEVSAAVLPMEVAEALNDVQIALETDATPGRAFSVSRAISSAQRRELLDLFRQLSAHARGRRILSGLALSRLDPVPSGVYEDAEQLLKGTWGY